MLLPSSIQRADDFVGIAIPIVGFLCASAPLLTAMAEKPASASVAIVALSFSMLRSLRFPFRARSKRDRELFDAEISIEYMGHRTETLRASTGKISRSAGDGHDDWNRLTTERSCETLST
jgi:hypothetical protein